MQATLVILDKEATEPPAHNAVNTAAALAMGLAAIIAAATLDGAVLWVVAGAAFAYAVLMEPRLGLFMVAAVVAADSASYDPITEPLGRLYQGIPGALASPVELLILWTCVSWVIHALPHSQLQLPDRTVLLSSIGVVALVLVSIVNGVTSGGNFNLAIWETRALLAVLPVTLLTCGLLRERRQVIQLLAVLLVTNALMSAELLWRYLTLIKPQQTGGPLEAAFSHDGTMLVSALAVASGAIVLWGPNKRARLTGIALCVLACAVVLASRRRASVVGMEVGFAAIAITLLITNWRRFTMLAPVALVLAALYIGAFWNNPNALGQPARGFKSIFMSDTVAERDKSSDDYRRIEKLNLWWGILANPVQGIGFGVPYPKPMPMINLSGFWPFWDYIPHNTMLWLWLKGGVLTFMAFWFLLGTVVSHGISIARKVKSPSLTAIVGATLAYFLMTVMFAYVDLGFTSPRVMILFGLTLGMLTALERAWSNTRTIRPA